MHSGDVDSCNAAYQTFSTTGDPTDYTSMQNACNVARSDLASIQSGFSVFDTTPSSSYGTTINSLQATSTALSSLPSNAVSHNFDPSHLLQCSFFAKERLRARTHMEDYSSLL